MRPFIPAPDPWAHVNGHTLTVSLVPNPPGCGRIEGRILMGCQLYGEASATRRTPEDTIADVLEQLARSVRERAQTR